MKILLAVALFFAGTVNVQALNRWVTIINDTGYTMVTFQASNRDQTSWGGDWFGPNIVLYSGEQIDINLDDGSGYCVWDLKATFSDGDEVTRMGLNVCEVGSWRVY
ncbi:MAG: hypothetical protein JKY31_05480 [Rhodobacteraceae bacterium]|nr:hypothetical protein [Paracoccaceae bacterium]